MLLGLAAPLSAQTPPPRAAALGAVVAGYDLAPGARRWQWRVQPSLGFDPNMNDGLNGAALSVGGLEFAIAPEDQARKAWVVGLHGSGLLLWKLAPDLVARARLGASVRREIGGRAQKSGVMAELCLGHLTSHWSELQLCSEHQHARSPSGHETRQAWRAAWADLAGPRGPVALSGVWVRRETAAGGPAQGQAGVDLSLAMPTGGRMQLGLALGARETARHVMRQRVALGYATPASWGRLRAVSLGYELNEGGRFLGQLRREESYSLGASVALGQMRLGPKRMRLEADLALNARRAGHALLARRSLSVQFAFRF